MKLKIKYLCIIVFAILCVLGIVGIITHNITLEIEEKTSILD